MSEEVRSGYPAQLTITGEEGSRWLLDGHEEPIRMNKSDAAEEVAFGDSVHVFVYTNRRGELVATMEMPNMFCGTYGWATITRIEEKEGVYVDIGSSFEVLVNRADMPRIRSLWPQPGDALCMTLRTDLGGNLFGRLVTEERMMEEVYQPAPPEKNNANLKARAYRLLPVGSFLVSEPDNYRIFVHHTEQAHEPRLGQLVDVRIIKVHEDGTVNGSMKPRVEERLDQDAERIIAYLEEVGGKMPFTDKSDPEEIVEVFQMSKGAFKRALGRLMKMRKIEQKDGWTRIA